MTNAEAIAAGPGSAPSLPSCTAPTGGSWLREYGAPIALAALMLGLALFGLTSKGLWQDEGFTWSGATLSNGKFLHLLLSTEANGGIYLVLQHVWVQAGTALWWLRLPSVLFAVAAVPVLWVLTRRLFDPTTATITAALLVVNGTFLQHAQEARTYTLVVLLACASMYWFVREMDQPDRGNRRWWVVLSVLLVLAHVIAALVVVAQLVSLVVARPDRGRRRHVLVGAAAIALVAVPFALLVRSQPGGLAPYRSLRFFASGVRHVIGGGDPLLIVEGLAASGALFLLVVALRAHGRSDEAWRLGLPALWFGLSTALLFVYTQISLLFADRYLLGFLPGLLILVAVCITHLPARALRVVALVVVFTLCGRGVWKWYNADSREGWREMATVMQHDARPGDVIVFEDDEERIPFAYSVSELPTVQRRVTPVWPGGSSWTTGFHTGDDHAAVVSATTMRAIAAQHDRVWVVDPGSLSDETAPAIRALEKAHVRVLDRHFDGPPSLQLYERR